MAGVVNRCSVGRRREVHRLCLAVNSVTTDMHDKSKISERIEDDGGVLDEILLRSEEKGTIVHIEHAIDSEEYVRASVNGRLIATVTATLASSRPSFSLPGITLGPSRRLRLSSKPSGASKSTVSSLR